MNRALQGLKIESLEWNEELQEWLPNIEKFAQLIVRECMEQINKVEEKGDAHLGGGYFYDGTRLCRDAIKQHFGLEQ